MMKSSKKHRDKMAAIVFSQYCCNMASVLLSDKIAPLLSREQHMEVATVVMRMQWSSYYDRQDANLRFTLDERNIEVERLKLQRLWKQLEDRLNELEIGIPK